MNILFSIDCCESLYKLCGSLRNTKTHRANIWHSIQFRDAFGIVICDSAQCEKKLFCPVLILLFVNTFKFIMISSLLAVLLHCMVPDFVYCDTYNCDDRIQQVPVMTQSLGVYNLLPALQVHHEARQSTVWVGDNKQSMYSSRFASSLKITYNCLFHKCSQ